jgi:hypothetical protein
LSGQTGDQVQEEPTLQVALRDLFRPSDKVTTGIIVLTEEGQNEVCPKAGSTTLDKTSHATLSIAWFVKPSSSTLNSMKTSTYGITVPVQSSGKAIKICQACLKRFSGEIVGHEVSVTDHVDEPKPAELMSCAPFSESLQWATGVDRTDPFSTF